MVNAVNAAPVVTTTGTTLAYTENAAATPIDPGLTLSDADSLSLTGATVTLSANYVNGQDVLAFTNQLGITGSWNAGTGALTLTGTATLANYEAALRTVTYVNTSETPSTATRTVSFVVNDGAANSVPATRNIAVTAVNDAPTVTDGALSFDGTDLVVVAPQPNLIVTSTLTMEAMVQRTGVLSGTEIIVNKEGEYELGISAAGKLQWAFANATPGWAWVETSYTLPADTWVHIAVTYNGGVVKTYANGTLVHTYNGTGSIGDVYSALNDFTIGGRQNASTQRFNGLIDEVRIWNVERSGAQIQAAYSTALTGSEFGLVGYWRFSESSGTTAIDSSTQGYDGALGNGAATDVPTRTLNSTTSEDNVLVGNAPGVLTRATDPEGSPLTAALVTGPANAAAFTLNPDGSFSYTPSANFTGLDTFTYRANDGTADSNVATVTIDVTPVNDAPLLDIAGSPVLAAIDQNAGAPSGAVGTLVSSLVDFALPIGQVDNVSDPDSGAELGIAVTAVDTGNGSWWYSTDDGSNWIALGAVSDAGARLLAADAGTRLYFQPTPGYSGTLASAITFRAWDRSSGSHGGTADTSGANSGGATAFSTVTDTASLVVNAVNAAPVVTTTGTTLAYTENAAATAIDPGLTLSDADSLSLTGATVTLSANYVNGQDVLAFTNQLGITGSWNAGTGALTLTGTATLANYETALRTVTYVNTSETPSTATRTVSFVVNDGAANSVTATRNIGVAAVNDLPSASDDAYAVNEDSTLVVSPSASNLSHWWNLNEGGSSQAVVDSGTLTNNGTLGSTAGVDAADPTWTTGHVGGAGLSFDGAGDYVATSSTELKSADSFTLSAWFQTNTTTGAHHILWQGYPGGNGYGSGGSTTSATSEMSLSIGSWNASYDNRIVFSLGYDVPDNGADCIFIASASPFTDTSGWHHVAVTVSDLGGGVLSASLYVDGKLEGTDTGSQNDRSVWDAMRIGASGDGSRSFNGQIDEVRVYETPLSGAQVQALAWAGILQNDADADLGALSAVLVTGPANAAAFTLNPDGSFSYTPSANFTGLDTFTYRANDGTADSNVATVTIDVTPVNDAPTGIPTISGTPTEDQTLTADTSAISDADGLGAFSYQWQRDGVAIGGATASTYTLSDADVGTQISVRVGFTDAQGTRRRPADFSQRRTGGQRQRRAERGADDQRRAHREPDADR